MSDFKFFCPECAQKIAVDERYSGQPVTCPTCQKSVVAPRVLPEVPQPAPAQTAQANASSSSSTANVPRVFALSYPYVALVSLVVAAWWGFGSIPKVVVVWAVLAFIPLLIESHVGARSRRMTAIGLKVSCIGLGLLVLSFGATKLMKQYFSPRIVIRESQADLDALKPRIVDEVLTGDSESEQGHQLGGKNLLTGPFDGKLWRSAIYGGSISYVMKVLPDQPMSLNCRYWGGEQAGRTFDIWIEDEVIATQNLEFNVPGHFFDAEYKIPGSLTRGKDEVTVKFQAHPGLAAGGLFGCQTLKR